MLFFLEQNAMSQPEKLRLREYKFSIGFSFTFGFVSFFFSDNLFFFLAFTKSLSQWQALFESKKKVVGRTFAIGRRKKQPQKMHKCLDKKFTYECSSFSTKKLSVSLPEKEEKWKTPVESKINWVGLDLKLSRFNTQLKIQKW